MAIASRPGVVAFALTGVAALAAAGVDGPAMPLLPVGAAEEDALVLAAGTDAAVSTGVLAVALEFFRCRALPFLPFSAEPSLGVFGTLDGAGDSPCACAWLAVLLLPDCCCCCRFIALMRGDGEEMEAVPGGPIPPGLLPSCEAARCMPGRCMLAGDEPICTEEKWLVCGSSTPPWAEGGLAGP